MLKHAYTKLFVVVLSCILACVAGVASPRIESTIPIVSVITPSQPTPGSQITVHVYFNQEAETDLRVVIGTTTPSNFSQRPAWVTLPEGDDHLSFTATVATGASGSIDISATLNGVTASDTTSL